MDTSTGTRLVRHVVVTVLLAATAVVAAWNVLFTGTGMGVSRYAPGQVFSTPVRGAAVQTDPRPITRVMYIQRDPLQPGVPNAK
jgi:hypothetical protein